MKPYNLFGRKRAWAAGEGGTRRKQYGSYEEYVAHQRAKLVAIFPQIRHSTQVVFGPLPREAAVTPAVSAPPL